MRSFHKLFFAILVLCFIFVTYQASAVGTYITELPFRGSYNVQCGYHTQCTNPPTSGYGLDFVNVNEETYGDVVYASGRGTVTTATDSGGDWGKTVVITHPDTYRSRYAHLAYQFPYTNQKMREGSPIGYMGATGVATGDHLHFQTYLNTETGGGVDPGPIDGIGVGGFCNTQNDPCGPFATYTFSTDMRLVDNTDGGFSLTGTASCFNGTQNGYHIDGLGKTVTYFRYCNGTTGSPTRTGRWTPVLPSSGNYHIYVFIPEHSGLSLTRAAKYHIYSNNTLISTVYIYQQVYPNKWIRLGLFNLSTNGSYVELKNQTSDGRTITYDAVMFVKDF